ncbi:MAG: hypothetical protein IT371_22325 [Deltaproteobacteria bacterium]|nr:hypothetical protein [Deltaproteobacteria bacterium]
MFWRHLFVVLAALGLAGGIAATITARTPEAVTWVGPLLCPSGTHAVGESELLPSSRVGIALRCERGGIPVVRVKPDAVAVTLLGVCFVPAYLFMLALGVQLGRFAQTRRTRGPAVEPEEPSPTAS